MNQLLNVSPSEIFWVILGFAVLIIYHLFLFIMVKKNPAYSIQSVNRKARKLWVEMVMSDSKHNILAVQTLRNSTMAATFFASTSVILVMGVLNLAGQGDKISLAHGQFAVSFHPQTNLVQLKMLLLLIDLLVAFFAFAMSLRLFNHAGFQINVPAEMRPPTLTPLTVTRQMTKAGNFYSLGMRAYYLGVPIIFWLFGSQYLAVSSIILVIFLFYIDRAGEGDS